MSSQTTKRCVSNLYDTPIRDASCAMPYSSQHIDIMRKCCGDTEIKSYYDDCGLFCLAKGQSVADLAECLYDEGAKWEDVFCRGKGEATVTGKGVPIPSASVRSIGEDGDAG